MISIYSINKDFSCKCCYTHSNLMTIQFNDGSIQLCKNCAHELAREIYHFIEPEKPHQGKWFTIWEQDKKNILSTMHRNLSADLDAGYNYTGQSIQKQLAAIDEYKHEFDEQLMGFVNKTSKEVEDWCYYDLKRRGSIE